MMKFKEIAAAGVALAALVTAALLPVAPAAAGAGQPKDVMHPCPVQVELYTSQGCNTCPPADVLLEQLDAREDVIGIAFHVDYWDYLGWKDSFALGGNAPRQRAYAKAMEQSYVYTPQAVVDGLDHFNGSDKRAIDKAIDGAKMMATVALKTSWDGRDRIHVDLPESGSQTVGPGLARGAAIWLAGVDGAQDVPITRGENAGKTLRYTNIVRSMERLGEWDGMAARVTIDAGALRSAGREKAVVMVQAPEMGRIIGAAEIRLDSAPGS